MVKIRLSRTGAKKRPFYHLVATDSRSPRGGKFIERLGYYNPGAIGGEQKLVFDGSRIEYWTKTGAQVSPRVAFLIKDAAKGGQVAKPKAKPKAKAAKPAKVEAKQEKPAEAEAAASPDAEAKEPAKAENPA